MNMDMLLSMSLPVEIFSTFHRFDNYYIDDMQYGDLSDLDFQRYAMSWEGSLAFEAQDHFGLGKEDITRELYKNFRFFRIWFFLQRHRDYAYKPLMTNFNAHVHIKGGV